MSCRGGTKVINGIPNLRIKVDVGLCPCDGQNRAKVIKMESPVQIEEAISWITLYPSPDRINTGETRAIIGVDVAGSTGADIVLNK